MFVDRTGAVINGVTVGLLNIAPLISYRFDSDPFTSCARDFRPWVIADEVALRKLLEEGGKVELRRSRVLARVDRFDVPVGASASKTLPAIDVAATTARLARETSGSCCASYRQSSRPLATTSCVSSSDCQAPAQTRARTSLSTRAASPSSTIRTAHGHHGAPAVFPMPPSSSTWALCWERLRGSGAAVGASLEVSLVAVPQSGRDALSTHAKCSSLELQLAESSTPAPRPLGATTVR